MKKILGLDLGTNSIGWALVENNQEEKDGRIIAANSRIIPMDQSILGDFEKGNTISQTAERTGYRGVRRLRERSLLRRERLHRVLHILGLLPKHYENEIDFDLHPGKFVNHAEPKIAYCKSEDTGKYDFFFKSSFNEMICDFSENITQLITSQKLLPYDWTIYYLRKKALTEPIEKSELAWILLNFNQKRGYYQLRGEEEEENKNKLVELYSLKVVDVIAANEKKADVDWYNVVLENGWIYRRQSKVFLDWVGQTKDFIVTTELNDDGTVKLNKYGEEKRTFKAPEEKDWTLVKKKTEAEIEHSEKTVGEYIYDTLLANPDQKIKGKLVRTIERKFYKNELEMILNAQKQFHPELRDRDLYNACVEELYPHNYNHRDSIRNRDFTYLFIDDILFYQRPLKSKKSLISNCPYEVWKYKDKDGNEKVESIKCIAKSHPLFQEFRLWQFIQNLKVYIKETTVDGKLQTDVNVTPQFFPSEKEYVELFEWLNERKEIDQKAFLKYPPLGLKGKVAENYRWNYVEDKIYPCNETHALIKNRLNKIGIPQLKKNEEEELWHILYSVEDRQELLKALTSFSNKKNLPSDFVEEFIKFPPFKKEYGAYSAKAIKKLLSVMRLGKYWSEDGIDVLTKKRINKLIDGEWDEQIKQRTREKVSDKDLTSIEQFRGLPLWLACYVVYDRHSESGDILKWNSPDDIEHYLRDEFKQHSLRNPIVEQVITETLRVVKDVWKYYGKGKQHFFDEIHVELGRDIKNPADKRKQMTNRITENENTNLRIKAILTELKNDPTVENVRPYSPSQQEILKIFEEDIINSGIEIPDDILKISRLSQPTSTEIIRYKLWLEQKYRSPYTGEIIPLSKLFTPAYEIEHIIPQSRYFDDSFSNKVICESAVNKDKDNKLGFEYIRDNRGKKVEVGFGKEVTIFTVQAYEEFVKSRYRGNYNKMKKLLLEDIPESFITRQMNDSRYISRVVQHLLSAIVRTDDEQETVSKNLISCNGTITTRLKNDWGMNDVWNDIVYPRFVRMNDLTSSNDYGEWINKEGKKVFQTRMPLLLQKGFEKKRIDHRHHAMDAIVIACASRNHINYLNNSYANKDAQRKDLRSILCYKSKQDDKGNYQWVFNKPWHTFTQDSKEVLKTAIVSFKQNLRVINKTVNQYQKWVPNSDGVFEKKLCRQTKGDSWAIRKPMHKETVYGKISLRFKKEVNLSAALDNWESIVDKELKSAIKNLINQYGKFDKKILIKYFKDREYRLGDKNISKVEIYYFDNNISACRSVIDESFNSKRIGNVSDTGIQKILFKHLESYNEIKNNKVIEHPDLAFSADGIDTMNKNIIQLNDGVYHKPIFRVRVCEPIGNKFNVGTIGNNKNKYVEAAKGTNLFFGIYQNQEGKRSYETIPLNIVIERQKQGLSSVPEVNEKGDQLLFSLSPNDLVYLPTLDEIENQRINWDDKITLSNRIYKMVSCTEGEFHCIPYFIASPILKTIELGSNNKSERAWTGEMIKNTCVKINVDRLGNLIIKDYDKENAIFWQSGVFELKQ